MVFDEARKNVQAVFRSDAWTFSLNNLFDMNSRAICMSAAFVAGQQAVRH